MSAGNNLVSVIIPTYNRAQFLKEAIHSVLNQTWQALEIIIIDDGSTDNTRDIIKEFSDAKIRYFHREHTGLIGDLRMFGISQAIGDYLSFLDSDDLWVPEKIEVQMQLLTRYPHAYFCISHGEQFGSGAIPPPPMEELFVGSLFKAQLIEERFIYYCGTLLFKRSALENQNKNNIPMPTGDTLFFFWLASRVDGIFTGEILAKIRKHETNTSGAKEQLYSKEHIGMLEKFAQWKLLTQYDFKRAAAKQYYKLGLLYLRAHKRREAVRTFGKVIGMKPFSYKGYVRLFQSLLAK